MLTAKEARMIADMANSIPYQFSKIQAKILTALQEGTQSTVQHDCFARNQETTAELVRLLKKSNYIVDVDNLDNGVRFYISW